MNTEKIKNIYIVYSEYIGHKKIVGIFKDKEAAEFYRDRYSDNCYILNILTDLIQNESEA
jgi:hypothetical protein